MSDEEVKVAEEIWVNLSEATEITGYNYNSLRKVIWQMAQEPEEQRSIKIKKRSNAWELWLPDLMNFMQEPRRGPQAKRKKDSI